MKTTRRKRKTSQNKKVKNATPNVYDGIQFKSQLETYVYKQLRLIISKQNMSLLSLN